MKVKTSVEMYRKDKLDMKKENVYNNSKGSALLFDVRAGCLRSKRFVGKYVQNDGVCVVCGKGTESMRHLALEPECIHTNLHEGNIRLPEAEGFVGSSERVTCKAVEATKRRLEC